MNIVHLQLSGGIGGISVLTRDLAGISDHNNIFYFLFEGGVIADEGTPEELFGENASERTKQFLSRFKNN